MPCGSIAVVAARIEAKHTEELLLSEPGLRALAKALVPVFNGEEPVLAMSRGQAVLRVASTGVQVILDEAGLRVTARYMRLDALKALTDRIAGIAQSLAIPLAQERIVKGLADRYGQLAVTGDQRAGESRVVKLRIPL